MDAELSGSASLPRLPPVCARICFSDLLLFVCHEHLPSSCALRGSPPPPPPLPPRESQGTYWPFTEIWKVPYLQSPPLTPPDVRQRNVNSTACQCLIRWLTSSPSSRTHKHTHLLMYGPVYLFLSSPRCDKGTYLDYECFCSFRRWGDQLAEWDRPDVRAGAAQLQSRVPGTCMLQS